MIRVAVAGGCGRMGSEVAKLVRTAPDMELSGIVERKNHPGLGTMHFDVEVIHGVRPLLRDLDVLVDFTSPDGLMELLEEIKDSSVSLVSGTTALTEREFGALRTQARHAPVLWSPNMSLGVNLLFKLTAQAAHALKGYDVEILEMHHRHKKDAPSGTARRLAEIVKEEHKTGKMIYGREGMTGERDPDEIGVLALRAGDVAGEHTLFFATEGERLELTHRASSRLCFARGTLEAIRFVVGREPGFYEYRALLEEN